MSYKVVAIKDGKRWSVAATVFPGRIGSYNKPLPSAKEYAEGQTTTDSDGDGLAVFGNLKGATKFVKHVLECVMHEKRPIPVLEVWAVLVDGEPVSPEPEWLPRCCARGMAFRSVTLVSLVDEYPACIPNSV